MPSYVATGADAKSGEDRTITFDADDDVQASAVAKARGVFVSKLERMPTGPIMSYQSKGSEEGRLPLEKENAGLSQVLFESTILFGKFFAVGLLVLAAILSIFSNPSFAISGDSLESRIDHLTGVVKGVVCIGVAIFIVVLHYARRER